LYGVPGSGKTEFARALGKASGKPVYDVNHVTTENLFGGRIALETARAAYKAGTAILIVDEADELLNMQSYSSSFLNSTNISGKGYLNDFMDRNESQIIWICNKISGMEVSSARRFSHSIQFKKHSTRRRQEIWKEHLRRHPYKKMITPEDVTEMARKYQIDSSGIANALTQVAKTVSPKEASRKVVMDTLETLLSGHEKLTGSENTSRMSSLSSQYDVDAIRTDIPTKEVIHSLQSFNGNSKCNACANLLFWGATGTGKTAFAQYLAFTLEKELMIKRASDLLSMWVGGTEQNIKDAFAQAEHEKAILLLDEADSFFIDRTTAVRSWESSQTNEFLTQMENYRGILVCCTNLLSNLDQAVLRRFAWKVHFQPPTAEGRKRIYIRYFGGSDKKIPDSCMELISRMDNLMPGDIKAVWTRFQFRSLNYWNHEEVVQALAQEVSYRVKKGPIEGFQTL
jgi:SpoVK/Ycf46/Vps4 family AAA+-type ATPase